MYSLIARLIWRIHLSIERRRIVATPDLYLDPQGRPCTIDAAGQVIVFGVGVTHESSD